MIIAGTGHRPAFCPCKYDESHEWFVSVRSTLVECLQAFKDETKYVISGVAIGWDTWLAEAALEVGVPVHAYAPFRDQGKKWPPSSQKRYRNILDKADKVLYISEEYSNEAFLKRDRAMVDAATQVYALLNPVVEKGGTFYTVNYAKRNKTPVTSGRTNMDDAILNDGLDKVRTSLSRSTRHLPKSVFWPITTFRYAVDDRLEDLEPALETLFERTSP